MVRQPCLPPYNQRTKGALGSIQTYKDSWSRAEHIMYYDFPRECTVTCRIIHLNQWHSLHTWCWLLRFAWWMRWIILTRHATAFSSCSWSSEVTEHVSWNMPDLRGSLLLWSSRNRKRLSVVSGEMPVAEHSWKHLDLINKLFNILRELCHNTRTCSKRCALQFDFFFLTTFFSDCYSF